MATNSNRTGREKKRERSRPVFSPPAPLLKKKKGVASTLFSKRGTISS